MSKDVIKSIKSAEEEAARIRAEASERAGVMITEARKKAELLKLETEERTGEDLKRTLALMKDKADELTEKSLSEAREEADQFISKAEIKKLTAVKKIVWEITEKCQL